MFDKKKISLKWIQSEKRAHKKPNSTRPHSFYMIRLYTRNDCFQYGISTHPEGYKCEINQQRNSTETD